MGILRSEDMGLYWLNMPRESAYDIISALGRMNSLQFIDADEKDTPAFSRHFHNNMKRCDDTLQKLEEIESEIHKFDLEITKTSSVNGYLNRMENILNNYQRTNSRYFEELEAFVQKKLVFMHQLLHNFDDAVANRNRFIEMRAVLSKATTIYNQQVQESGNILTALAGTLDIHEKERFVRTVFRATKGNAYTVIEEINPSTRKNQQLLNAKDHTILRKCVFIIFFQKGTQGYLKQRLTRVCESYGANICPMPDDHKSQGEKLAESERRIMETNDLVRLNETELDKFFREFIVIEGDLQNEEQTGPCSKIEAMRLYCIREKLIYMQMNLLNPKNSIYQGLVWIEKSKEFEVMQALNALTKANPNLATGQLHKLDEYNIAAPTYIRGNDFTTPFQEIVNTYGVPRYKEINPGLFTCISFPFLFGVMFGDIGHGSLMLLFGLYLLTLNPNKAKPGPLDGVYNYRYLIVLLATMAVFCGMMYNDFFGMSINFFGSCYDQKTHLKDPDCNYPFGLDPVWGIAKNKLQEQNSLKMKLAVILGIAQMIFGIFLKAVNSIYFKNALDFFFEFVPQLVFLSCTFGYMCFMIVLKWLINWENHTDQAPSILTALLRFFLNFGETDPTTADLFPHQSQIQLYLLTAAIIAVPLMLLPKPLILSMKHGKSNDKSQDQQQQAINGGYIQQIDEEIPQSQNQNQEEVSELRCPYMEKQKPFDFGEEMVHQVIETIEFVLGCISHTASYLRLWALSLAHSQLSEVFFEKTLKGGLVGGNVIAIMIGFAVFAAVTFGVLMLMDAMECFLHTLRLHWVEFQSKFFKADGYIFTPFSYVKALEA